VFPELPQHPRPLQLADFQSLRWLWRLELRDAFSSILDANAFNRILAILLSTMSLLVHTGVFAVLETALAGTWTGSWCAWYDVFAVFASLAGVIGAVDVRAPRPCSDLEQT
jgi:hypothetical protein